MVKISKPPARKAALPVSSVEIMDRVHANDISCKYGQCWAVLVELSLGSLRVEGGGKVGYWLYKRNI